MEGKQLMTNKEKQALELKKAHGLISVLAIGIDNYDKASGFCSLKTCSNDAMEVRNAFQDIWQLNADKTRVWALTSKSSPPPSRGEIIKAVKKLGASAEPGERILFYYSGHGHRIKRNSGKDEFHIVPQDAYSDSDPQALIKYEDILKILQDSDAKQIIIVLDACMSGPDVTGKKVLPAKYSPKFLAEYMKETKGIAVISSSTGDQASLSQSPNPKLSLFTYYFITALRGDSDALDNSMLLTVNSMYDYVSTKVKRRAKSYHGIQFPSIDIKASGIFILGNYAQSIISPDSFDIEGYPVSRMIFEDWEPLSVKDVLTEIRRWRAYSQQYLEGRVNSNLGTYLEEGFGEKVSILRKKMGFSTSDISIEEKSIIFPGGVYMVEYVAEDLKEGKLIVSLILESEWFSRSLDIADLVDCFDMRPELMILELAKSIKPESAISGLEAKGWDIKSQLSHKIKAEKNSYTLIIEKSTLSIQGFTPKELFGKDSDKGKARLALSALALIVGKT